MRKYIKEIIVLALQLFMFYIFPLFAGPTDVIGMVVLIIASTALLSLILGIISKQGIKFAYPLVVSIRSRKPCSTYNTHKQQRIYNA